MARFALGPIFRDETQDFLAELVQIPHHGQVALGAQQPIDQDGPSPDAAGRAVEGGIIARVEQGGRFDPGALGDQLKEGWVRLFDALQPGADHEIEAFSEFESDQQPWQVATPVGPDSDAQAGFAEQLRQLSGAGVEPVGAGVVEASEKLIFEGRKIGRRHLEEFMKDALDEDPKPAVRVAKGALDRLGQLLVDPSHQALHGLVGDRAAARPRGLGIDAGARGALEYERAPEVEADSLNRRQNRPKRRWTIVRTSSVKFVRYGPSGASESPGFRMNTATSEFAFRAQVQGKGVSRGKVFRGVLFGGLLIACAGCTTFAPRTPADREAQWSAAERATANEDWELAAALWNEIRRGDPRPAVEPYLETARALDQIDRQEDALAILEAADDAFPERGDVLLARGSLLDEMGFERAAEASLQAATRLRPEDPGVWAALGHVQLQLDNAQMACESLRRAGRLGFAKPGDMVLCARAEQAAGEIDSAFSTYRRAIESTPDPEPEWLTEAAALCADPALDPLPLGGLALSREWAAQALEEFPQDPEAHFVAALLDERAGELQSAVTHYRRAVELDNHHLGATNNLALLYIDLGETTAAVGMLDRALLLETSARRRAALRSLRNEALETP